MASGYRMSYKSRAQRIFWDKLLNRAGESTNERKSMSNVEQPEAEALTPPEEVPTGDAPHQAGPDDGLDEVPESTEVNEVEKEPDQVQEGPPLGEPEATLEERNLPEPGQVTS